MTIYLSCVFWACSASVSHLSAISMKSDLCADVRASSASRMHSAALLRNWSKLGESASICVDMGTDRARQQRCVGTFCQHSAYCSYVAECEAVSSVALNCRRLESQCKQLDGIGIGRLSDLPAEWTLQRQVLGLAAQ
jgi:hypothetical protein